MSQKQYDSLSLRWPITITALLLSHRTAFLLARGVGVATATEDGVEPLAVGTPLHQCNFGLTLAGVGVDTFLSGFLSL